LCERFIREGHTVVGLDNFLTGAAENVAHLDRSVFSFIEHDVTQPFDVPGHVDYVLHFASPASPIDYIKLPLETLMVGSYGTHNTLELARRKDARFLLASTSEVYGDPEVHPQPETYYGNVNSVGQRSCYDEAKRYAEAVTMSYHTHLKLDTRIVRIFNTYGPRMRLADGRVVPAFIDQALKEQPLTVFGDGSQTRSFCYVDDLVEGIYRLLLSDYTMPVNVGTQFEMTILDFARLILRLSGSSSGIAYREFKTKDDPSRRRPDSTRAREILGWEPKVALEDGLKRTIEFFRGKVGNDQQKRVAVV